MTILAVEDLTIDFRSMEGGLRAVDGATFEVAAGRTTALVGESGSGKTVISQAIMGILPQAARITGGRLLFDDPATGSRTDIAALDPAGNRMRALRGNRIGIVFQEPMTSLSPLHTIGDQIGESAELHLGLTAAQARAATRDMLKLVQFPDPERALDTYTFELSGGLRQRAMIAMALICRPALLIADEPTTALDVTIQAEILKLMRSLQAELGMSILLITHDFGVVANMADDVVVIYRGRIMESGPVADIFGNPQHPYLKALLNAVPRFNMAPNERLVPLREIKPQTGGHLMKPREEAGARGQPILEVDRICKSFPLRSGGFFSAPRMVRALDAVSFVVRRGECLGLVGESGSGKTTTAMAILRAITPDSGQIRVALDGTMRDIATLEGPDLMTFRRKLQVVFQDPFSSLNPRMTVYDILSEPFIIHKTCDIAERNERIGELMRLVGLDERHLRRYPHSFSGGQRQRIGIARALALGPEIVLCDEPVSALDVSVQAQILNLLRDLKDKLGLTYIFVSHNLAVVDYIADRIAVMCRGLVVELADKTDLIRDPRHPYTRALLAAVPEPRLDALLDFEALSAGRASDPMAWPEPFRPRPGPAPALTEVSPGHFVLAPGLVGAEAA
ncbi:peptide/nickel transport system ATP-binding protein [Tepidamorphus gemmatus]|uniref:Peptide/nickel transport system ATP-binding protein n=1 Tax=Tepidamorphus gemmatus TaxID=747076 RepID=A0A4R3M886_9HYPH|nr:ABC transporter ATP-binding protein [Tepidamorphus gemmatus]TCT09312.1 peptide/nickel transport system ATP-binding protein [Tepidamorphus gemmatus]